MAQPIHCDGDHDEPVLADVMITRLDGTSAVAFCDADYIVMALGIAQAVMADQEAEAAAEAAATDAEALRRLGEDTAEAPDPGTAHVVRRGTSRSRQAFEARKRTRPGDDDDGDPDEPEDAREAEPAGVTPDTER